jgi:hypothetical protein
VTAQITYHWPINVQFDLGAIGGWFGGGGSGTNDHTLLSNLNAGAYRSGGHLYLVQRIQDPALDPGANNDQAATDPTHSACLVGAEWVNTATGQVWVCVSNAIGAAVWKKVTDQSTAPEYQTTLIDDTTTNIIVGSAAADRMVWMEYVLQTSTAFQTGSFRVIHDGAGGTDPMHEYNFTGTEIDSVVFTTDVNAGNIRINVQCISVGEDPKLRYTLRTIDLPT